MVNYMKYRLSFICVSPDGKHHEESNYDVSFSYNENQYGNGTSMYCKNLRPGYANYSFDIRYDRDYSNDRQIQYITDWALNTWNGENGSWKISNIHCYALEEII